MRTTLTLDPDVAALLKKALAKGDQSFKDVVNSALRKGLEASETASQAEEAIRSANLEQRWGSSFPRRKKSRNCSSKKTSRGSIVILVDVNLLVYVGSPSSPEHDRTREWFEERMNSGERVGLPWHSLFGFLRVATKRSVASESLAMR